MKNLSVFCNPHMQKLSSEEWRKKNREFFADDVFGVGRGGADLAHLV